MTANVTVITDKRENALTIPNSALRFRPPSANAPQDGAAKPKQRPNANAGGNAHRTVWKVEGEELRPARVELGMTDGVNTEVVSGDLAEGDKVAIPAPTAGELQGRSGGAVAVPDGRRRRRGYGR